MLKFTQVTNVRFYQVLADAQIGGAAIVYTLTHESVRVERE